MNGVHKVLEAALEYDNVPEEIRREFRAEMGVTLVGWSMDFIDLPEATENDDERLSLPENWRLDKDPDLWLIRDERGDVICGVSAETAMTEAIERIAWGRVEAREEIREEAASG